MVCGADPGRATPAPGTGFDTSAGNATGADPGHAAASAGAFISQVPPGS